MATLAWLRTLELELRFGVLLEDLGKAPEACHAERHDRPKGSCPEDLQQKTEVPLLSEVCAESIRAHSSQRRELA